MTTYGDMMTLLLTFFVLLLSFSSIQEAAFRRMVGSLKGALGVLPYEQSVVAPEYIPIPQLTNLQEAEIQESLVELQEASNELDISESVKLEKTEEGIHITLSDSLLFDSGRARIKPAIVPVLLAIVNLAQGWPNTILVEGHTDNVPIHNEQYASNLYLSAARAIAMVEFFAANGIEEEKMVQIGRGEYEPIDTNETERGRARNRRVEIYIQYDIFSGGPPGNTQKMIERLKTIF